MFWLAILWVPLVVRPLVSYTQNMHLFDRVCDIFQNNTISENDKNTRNMILLLRKKCNSVQWSIFPFKNYSEIVLSDFASHELPKKHMLIRKMVDNDPVLLLISFVLLAAYVGQNLENRPVSKSFGQNKFNNIQFLPLSIRVHWILGI